MVWNVKLLNNVGTSTALSSLPIILVYNPHGTWKITLDRAAVPATLC